MKAILYHFLVCVAVISAIENTYAQKERKNYVSMNYSFGGNVYNTSGITGSFQSNEYEGGNFESITIEYARQTAPNVEFCTGLTATVAYLSMASIYNPIAGSGGSTTSNYRDKIFIYSLPLHLKYHFLKYLFVEGGFDLNYHPSVGGKYGIGLTANIGVEYVFRSGIMLFASPFGRWNLMGSAGNEHNSRSAGTVYTTGGPDTLIQRGIKLGIGYRF